MRVVVIGGSGNFGARICAALAEDPAIDLVRCGRSTGTRLDIASPGLPQELRNLSPDVVIHCAGPFQGQDYRVALAALGAGAHYLDLADARGFVCGFGQAAGAAARGAGRLAVSGASTLPALSSAVVDSLAGRFEQVEQIHVVIAPAQRAPRGRATMAGVLGYAGTAVQMVERRRVGEGARLAEPAARAHRRRRHPLDRSLRRARPRASADPLSGRPDRPVPGRAGSRPPALRSLDRRRTAPRRSSSGTGSLGRPPRPRRGLARQARQRTRRHGGDRHRDQAGRQPRIHRMARRGRRQPRPRNPVHGRDPHRPQARARRADGAGRSSVHGLPDPRRFRARIRALGHAHHAGRAQA